jgi:hypothetical protein
MAEPEPNRRTADYAIAAGLFLRGLGLVYAIAFASLAVQAIGLYGAHGILPVARLLEVVHERVGGAAPAYLPTLFWLGAGDRVLAATCWIGVALGLALAAGLAPRISAALCWALYLSWVQVGQVFLGFQWDALLLETGLLAIWLAPGGLVAPLARARAPSWAPLLLLRWLVARLFLLSGLVKLASGDRAWRDLSAMTFHHWTQPLPGPLAPFVHALPASLHEIETLATFAIELGLPLLVFGPRVTRRIAAAGFLGLLAAINTTGNYGFFGPLAAVLCFPLVDDAVWRRLPVLRSLPPTPASPTPSRLRVAISATAFALVVLLTTGAALLRLRIPIPETWRSLVAAAAPLESFNAYGLFAVMTKDRLEIEVEGSRDGETWLPYEFRWKPDRVERPPPYVPLHMPRLDWQMWFAALDDCAGSDWFVVFQRRLLEGEPSVVGLLARDPFDGEKPRFVRTTVYRYRFADADTRRRTGAWWTRELLGDYCPTLELVDGALRAVP